MDNITKYALLFKMLCTEYDGASLGKKVSQKMFYFFEREGIELNLRYGIHYYGPYSSKLDNAMYELDSRGYISIDIAGATHVVRQGKTEAPGCLTEKDAIIARKVLDSFEHKSAMELEALSTMDYVANFLLGKYATESDIRRKFKEIKGSKFNDTIVKNTYQELVDLNLIAG